MHSYVSTSNPGFPLGYGTIVDGNALQAGFSPPNSLAEDLFEPKLHNDVGANGLPRSVIWQPAILCTLAFASQK